MNARKKSASRRKRKGTARSTKAVNRLPDLTEILHAFNDALALVAVAHRVIEGGGDYGYEECVLRMGVEALDAVYNRLDGADAQITHVRNKNAEAARGVA